MIAGLELGGTKCVAILADGPDGVADRRTVATTTPDETLGALEAILRGWRGRFEAIGIASFGPLDLAPDSPTHGAIMGTVKPGWSGTDLIHRFAAAGAGVPVALHTDVIGAALAEGCWGAARGLSDHVYITIGTGVGVGAIVNAAPAGAVLHGEGGHLRIARTPGDDFAGTCVFHGDCVEGLVSGPALAARTGLRGDAIPADHPVWDAAARDIAALLHALVVTLAPQRISIGGGVPTARADLFPRIRAALADSLNAYGLFGGYADTLDYRIGPPGLGAMAGPLGAIAVGLTAS